MYGKKDGLCRIYSSRVIQFIFDIYGASEYLALTHGATGSKNDDLPQFSLGIYEKMLEKICGFGWILGIFFGIICRKLDWVPKKHVGVLGSLIFFTNPMNPPPVNIYGKSPCYSWVNQRTKWAIFNSFLYVYHINHHFSQGNQRVIFV